MWLHAVETRMLHDTKPGAAWCAYLEHRRSDVGSEPMLFKHAGTYICTGYCPKPEENIYTISVATSWWNWEALRVTNLSPIKPSGCCSPGTIACLWRMCWWHHSLWPSFLRLNLSVAGGILRAGKAVDMLNATPCFHKTASVLAHLMFIPEPGKFNHWKKPNLSICFTVRTWKPEGWKNRKEPQGCDMVSCVVQWLLDRFYHL